MARIQPVPLFLKDVTLEIGTGTPDDFSIGVSSVTFTPTASTVSWTGLGLQTFTETTVATWAVALTYAQDWESTTSLSRYLFEHEGDVVPVTFIPKADGPSFTADVSVTPGAIGGTVNSYAETTVTLGSTKPELVPAA